MRKPFSSFGFGSPFSRSATRTIYSPGLCVRSVGCVILTSRNVSNWCKVTHIYDECPRKNSFIDTCNTTVYWSFDFSPIIPAIWSSQNWSSNCGNSINEQEVEVVPVDLVRRQARRSLHLPCPRRLAQVQRVADRWVYVCSMPVVASVLAEMICEWVSVLCILYSLVFNSHCSGSSSSSSRSFSLFVCLFFVLPFLSRVRMIMSFHERKKRNNNNKKKEQDNASLTNTSSLFERRFSSRVQPSGKNFPAVSRSSWCSPSVIFLTSVHLRVSQSISERWSTEAWGRF